MKVCEDLRQAVLQAAIQGKLTTQRKEDGNARDLLKQIAEEKAQLIKEKKIKKEKPLAEITEEEIPFDIPENWVWTRLGIVGSWGSGATPLKSKAEYYSCGTIPWLLTGDLNNGLIENIPNKITPLALKETSVKLNPIGSVLIAMYGATIGKVGILAVEATTNQACCACYPLKSLNNKYLLYYLLAHKVNFIAKGEGGAQPNISKEKIVSTVFPLPPLAEQEHIVAKVEKLMAEIDEMEKVEKELEALKGAFPEDIKASLLQAAMQGKLTTQRKEDGNARDLLKQIAEEKAQLIKEKKIKKEKPLAEITEEEIPFDIPENWVWVRLGNCFQFINGDRGKNYPSKDKLSEKGNIPFISAINIDGFCISKDRLLYLSDEQYNVLGSGKLRKNDVVVCIRGSLGKSCIYPFENGAIASSLVILRSVYSFNNFYLLNYIKSSLFYSEINKYNNGTAQPNLAAKDLAKFLIPLPPLAEQERIVAKLDKLLPLCDGLKEE